MRQRSFYQLIEAPVDEDKFPFGRADVAFRQGRNRKSKRAAFKSKIPLSKIHQMPKIHGNVLLFSYF